MEIYLKGYALYGFDQQRVFGARYMVGNTAASQEHKKHDESNMKYGGNALAKNKRKFRFPIVFYQ